MHLHTLPKFFSKDHSPMLATDSPFPPLKTEHRYRGVYERAGFDVNLRGPAPDSPSMRYSPMSPLTQSSRSRGDKLPYTSLNPFAARNVSSSLVPGQKVHSEERRNFSDSRLKNYSGNNSSDSKLPLSFKPLPENSASERSSGGSNPYSDPYGHLKSQEPNVSTDPYGHLKTQESNVSTDPYGHLKSHDSSASSNSSGSKYTPYKKFEANNPRLARENDVDRNVKNLKLHIPEGKACHNSQETSGTSATNSPFDTDRNERSSPLTSLGLNSETQKRGFQPNNQELRPNNSDFSQSSDRQDFRQGQSPGYSSQQKSPYPLSGAEGDLSDVLAGFKQDVANHKHYDPRADKSPVKSPDSFVPATTNLQLFNRNDDSSQDDELFRFDSARHSAETNETSAENSDYNNFLRTSTGKPGKNPHLSTISSIISKPFDDESDEDDEIELELKRQLENIKAGSSLSLDSTTIRNDDSFVTASNVLAALSGKPMPIFKVSAVDDESGSDTETEAERNDSEEEQPKQEPETPQFEKTNFDDALTLETPETIKPLSPKTHQVERELESLNFYDERTIPQELSYRNDEDEILRQNPTPHEFEAFPKSVIDPKVPSFRTSDIQRAKAGTGPCRSCTLPVEQKAKGLKKAIFSKTGELSGQWHRSCFKCLYAGCAIHFNKSVTSYVLLDNPFCNHHYHTLNDTLCHACHLGIEGECIENELKQKWHLQCLSCTKCQRQIKSDYFVIEDHIVCEEDSRVMIADLQRNGMLTSDKVEKRRTRMLFID